MHCRFLIVAFIAGSCAFSGHVVARQPRMVDEIMADTGQFASAIDAQLRRTDDRGGLRNIDNVAPDMSHASEWRFHSRHGGLLVAIPVNRNLTAAEKYGGEREIVDVVERLIRQRGMSGDIEVVFIEPAAFAPAFGTPCSLHSFRPQPPVACACH